MKKAFYIVMAAVLCCLVTVVATAGTDTPTTCQACGTVQNWEVLPASWKGLPAGHYHYYLDKDVTPAQLVTDEGVTGITICLDLNGHSINTNGRALIARGVVNIMDSSAAKSGYICGSTGNNNTASGSLAAINGGTIRLYSGTLRFKKDDTGHGLGKGGVVGIESGGTMEMLGGKIEGAELVISPGLTTYNGCGAAVFVYGGGKLNISGGEITSGVVPDGGQGSCVFLGGSSAKVTLSQNAKVAEICSVAKNGNITITGTYTGRANICFTDAVSVADGTVVGIATDADISGAELFCTNGNGYEIQKSGNNLVLKSFTPTATRHICQHCNALVNWKPVSGNTGLFGTSGRHHLYLSADYTNLQLNAKNGAQVCLDLYGKNVYTNGRAFHVGENGQLNIMDTVGGSTVTGTSGTNNPTGGTLAINGTGAVLNIYGGTYKMVQNGTGHGVGTGGVAYLSKGALNLYGGKLEGGDLVISGYELTTNGYGAAVYMAGSTQLNVSGGEITSGTVPTGGLGECVYLSSTSAKVKLSGNGSVEEIYCQKDTQPITVTGTYTGTAAIRFPEAQAILEEMPVGTCAGADISGAKLSCVNGRGYALVSKDGVLVVSSFGLDAVAATYSSTGANGYDTLQEAVDACDEGYVKLLKSSTQAVSVTKDLYLDLNGQSAVLTLSDGVTVYGFDCQTDDYTVADGKYGKLTVTGGEVKGLSAGTEFAEDSYLAVIENGAYSFHRVKLQIYAMSLRPDQAGLYYKSHFLADEKAAVQISSYGVALSVMDTPTAENLETACKYSSFTGFESGPVGNLGNASSTILKNILKTTNPNLKNNRNLRTQVFGRAYAKTTDGQVLLGQPVSRTLAEQLEAVDAVLADLSQVQAKGAVELYKKFSECLSGMQLPNLAEAKEKEGTLKVLSLGHSHGLDGTGLLYEVLDAELEEDIVVGALYYSGCSMENHAKFLTNNLPEYDYYKKDKTNVNGAWTITKETTGLYALQDEQWDVIVIQDANFRAGREEYYKTSDYMTVLNYLYNNQENKPRILFHMTWTNPDDYDNYISASSALSHPNLSWYKTYVEQYYSDENGVFQRELLIDRILNYTEKYLEDCTDFLGEKYIESVIPAATAVEYAQYVCGRTDQEIYRDWTHMNDYGRLIVAYTWYAKIMQLDQISGVNLTEVPVGAHHRNSKYPADLKFDEQMRADALASVNFALANPYLDIANGDPLPEN